MQQPLELKLLCEAAHPMCRAKQLDRSSNANAYNLKSHAYLEICAIYIPEGWWATSCSLDERLYSASYDSVTAGQNFLRLFVTVDSPIFEYSSHWLAENS